MHILTYYSPHCIIYNLKINWVACISSGKMSHLIFKKRFILLKMITNGSNKRSKCHTKYELFYNFGGN